MKCRANAFTARVYAFCHLSCRRLITGHGDTVHPTRMLALLVPCSSATIQPPCAPYIKGHAHLSSRQCMREELDFGDYLNRPSVHITGFKEIFQLKARMASVEETPSPPQGRHTRDVRGVMPR